MSRSPVRLPVFPRPPQAAALVFLVRRYPDTLERLEQIASGVAK